MLALQVKYLFAFTAQLRMNNKAPFVNSSHFGRELANACNELHTQHIHVHAYIH